MERDNIFQAASPDDVLTGRTTDIYFKRTVDILKAKGIVRNVKAEFCVKKFPRGWNRVVFSGEGTAISNAPVLDFSMDIIEIDGYSVAKRGKRSGVKSVFRCPKCFKRVVVPKDTTVGKCSCGEAFEDLLQPLIRNGKFSRKLESPSEIRKYVLNQIQYHSLED